MPKLSEKNCEQYVGHTDVKARPIFSWFTTSKISKRKLLFPEQVKKDNFTTFNFYEFHGSHEDGLTYHCLSFMAHHQTVKSVFISTLWPSCLGIRAWLKCFQIVYCSSMGDFVNMFFKNFCNSRVSIIWSVELN